MKGLNRGLIGKAPSMGLDRSKNEELILLPIYLLRDEFITTEVAPVASPRTCEPGPGTLTLVQIDGQFSIVDGVMQIPPQTTPDQQSLGFYAGTYARQGGRFIYAKMSRSDQEGTYYPFIGWGHSGENLPASINNTGLSIAFTDGGNLTGYGLSPITDPRFLPNVNYEFVLMLLPTTGGLTFIRGGTHDTWQLVWYSKTPSSLDLRPVLNTLNGPSSSISSFAVGDFLQEKYLTANGLMTNFIASPIDGVTTNMEADGTIEFDWTAAINEVLDIKFRWVDDDNCWILRCSQAGSTAKFFTRIAGVETERASSPNTFSNGVTYRISIRCKGIRYQLGIEDAVRVGVITFPQFYAATGVKIIGFTTGANLICWPLRVNLPIPQVGISNRFATMGDSKTDNAVNIGWQSYFLAAMPGWAESYRLGLGGSGVVNFADILQGDAYSVASKNGYKYVLLNLGVNDLGILAEEVFSAAYAAILDMAHAEFPNAVIGCAYPWSRGADAYAATMKIWINNVIATRSTWAIPGLDEAITIKAADNGVINAPDGAHYSEPAGATAAANGWITAMGL